MRGGARSSVSSGGSRGSVANGSSSRRRSGKRRSGRRVKRVKADVFTHLMALSTREAYFGRLDAKPIINMAWLMYKEPVSMEMLKKDVYEGVAADIFRYHAVSKERNGWTYFEDIGMRSIDESYHFKHVQGFDTENEWQAFLENEVRVGLDFTKPWWRFILVDSIPDGRCAVVSLSDHAMNDGASGISALLASCETAGSNKVFGSYKRVEKKRERLLTLYEKLMAYFNGITTPIVEQLLPNDAPSKLRQPEGILPKSWRFASTPFGEHLELSKAKEIKDCIPGATVNDVMLAITALSIREYYKSIKEPIMESGKDIRGTMAVNTRPRAKSPHDYLTDEMFGNKFAISTLNYPLHQGRSETLLAFRDQSRLRKASPDSKMRELILQATAKLVPRNYIPELAIKTQAKFSIMSSNVLFSEVPLRRFGQEIDDVRFVTCSPLGYYAGVATYCDKVCFGLVCSENVGVDPRDLLPYFKTEFEALYREVTSRGPAYYERIDKTPEDSMKLLAVALIAAVLAFLLLLPLLRVFLF